MLTGSFPFLLSIQLILEDSHIDVCLPSQDLCTALAHLSKAFLDIIKIVPDAFVQLVSSRDSVESSKVVVDQTQLIVEFLLLLKQTINVNRSKIGLFFC